MQTAPNQFCTRPLVKEGNKIFFLFIYFSTKTYVVGTQKIQTVLLSTQNMLKLMGKKIFATLRCLNPWLKAVALVAITECTLTFSKLVEGGGGGLINPWENFRSHTTPFTPTLQFKDKM